MNKSILTISSIAALLACSPLAFAHSPAADGDIDIEGDAAAGYVVVGGKALKTGDGECLKLGGFSEDNQVNACEGIADEEPVVEAEPEPEPEPAPAPAPEPVAKEPIVTTSSLGGEALFDTGSSVLTPASEQALADLVVEMQSYQNITEIQVTGHTDSRGSDELNQRLSQERAESVANFLKTSFPAAAVSAVGAGSEDPIATNSTAEGRQLNRRVEVQVTAQSVTE